MEMVHSRELCLAVLLEAKAVVSDSFSLTGALAISHCLKGKSNTSHQSAASDIWSNGLAIKTKNHWMRQKQDGPGDNFSSAGCPHRL